MSGICGYFSLDNRPVVDRELEAMTSMLECRGPERTGRWLGGRLGLGHTLLATTPELQIERQPLEHRETGCVITADVRLDNRDELFDLLAIRDAAIGDAGLILAAYLEWGEGCLDHLLGDFAFVVWDPRDQALFCARDHFGMRPLYYHHAPRQRFVFASDARAILALPQVPYRINAGRIADFLVEQLEWIDYTSTFFDAVLRLPPGHKAVVTPAEIKISEYWAPAPGAELEPMSDEDYGQGFLEVFTKAVDARLRAPSGYIGSMLSGGVDSGSVVAVASDILQARGEAPLSTYSATKHDHADCAESRAINAAITLPGIAPSLIYPENMQDDTAKLIAGNEEPFDARLLILKAIYSRAHQDGRRVLLDGAGGDVVFGEGSYIVRLMRNGHFRTALEEIGGEARFWGDESFFPGLLRYSARAFIPDSLQAVLRQLRRGRRVERRH
jgi:asparagine synthase (glutamine-hydrolysing)